MNDFRTIESTKTSKERAHRLALVYQTILSWKMPEEETGGSNHTEQALKKTEAAVDAAASVDQKANPQADGEFTHETV
jgi:hypothetical protein